MELKLNDRLEIMTLEDGDCIAFDPESGDTHFLNEAGSAIIGLLETPMDINTITSILALEYNSDVETIQIDIAPFLEDLLKKEVLIRS